VRAGLREKNADVVRCNSSCRQRPFRYRAGQFVEFILRDGSRRSYSMANAPHNLGQPPAIELHLRHMPGGKFTDHVFSAMKEGHPGGRAVGGFLREDGRRSCCWPGHRLAPVKAIISTAA
jgi:CDP-4-dehydro-6-deoxyglucose reductase